MYSCTSFYPRHVFVLVKSGFRDMHCFVSKTYKVFYTMALLKASKVWYPKLVIYGIPVNPRPVNPTRPVYPRPVSNACICMLVKSERGVVEAGWIFRRHAERPLVQQAIETFSRLRDSQPPQSMYKIIHC